MTSAGWKTWLREAPDRWARRHTMLALAALIVIGTAAFFVFGKDVVEGETLEWDESLMLAVRDPAP